MAALEGKAVVIGASMGGLLAARALVERYQNVVIIERDDLPECPVSRRGVPQGPHPHTLLERSTNIIGELFPGILDELVADGALLWDDGDLSRISFSVGGHQLVRLGVVPNGKAMPRYLASRPLYEWRLRQRLMVLPNVEILDGRAVSGLTFTPRGDRVTGVQFTSTGDGDETTLEADLVVDATGRGSRTPVFLEQAGYARPTEDELRVNVTYSSMPLRVPPGALHEYQVMMAPEAKRPRGFAMFAGEDGTYTLGVETMGGVAPPDGQFELIEYIADFAPASLITVLRGAEPLAEVRRFRVPSSRWRRYDKLNRLPAGLLVFGDAICSFNPIYGQGIAIAAIESLLLRDCLGGAANDIAQRFFAAAAKKIGIAWRTAMVSDLAIPEVAGRRTLSTRLAHAYLDRVLTAAETDPMAARQYLRVVGMLDQPKQLLRPAILLRAAKTVRPRASRIRRAATVPTIPALPETPRGQHN